MSPRTAIVLFTASLFAGCGTPPAETGAADSDAMTMEPAPAAGMVARPTTDAEKVANAMAAAPSAVSASATILDMDASGQPRTLREGSNGWTCMPDIAETPGVDPMCVDQGGMQWAMAWMEKRDPPADKMGFGYMLLGGSDASNTDPFAMEPPAGQAWVDTGPHVMVFNIGARFDGYPMTPDNPTAPYVMWPGTPYAHLMIPVE